MGGASPEGGASQRAWASREEAAVVEKQTEPSTSGELYSEMVGMSSGK